MADITLKGNPIHTNGSLPGKGDSAKNFNLVRQDLSEATLGTFDGKRKVLNIFPSIDTPVCAASVRAFNQKASSMDNVVVLNVSADLPFAMKRFCGAEGLEGVESLSTFRSTFLDDWGVKITDGPLQGLASRAVVVLDADNKVLHAEQVPEIGQEPNYDEALKSL